MRVMFGAMALTMGLRGFFRWYVVVGGGGWLGSARPSVGVQ